MLQPEQHTLVTAMKIIIQTCFYLLVAMGLLTTCGKVSNQLEPSAQETREMPESASKPSTSQPDEQQTLNEDRLLSAKKALLKTLVPTSTDDQRLEDYYNFKRLSASSTVTAADAGTALKLYLELMDNPNTTEKPVFEVHDSEKVLLPLNDGRVAAHVVLNKSTLTIEGIHFLPKSKTDKLGVNQDRFRAQFEGKAVTFNPDNFGLKPWDKPSFEGDVQIDGISGATDICQAALDLLNEQLPSFQGYLQPN